MNVPSDAMCAPDLKQKVPQPGPGDRKVSRATVASSATSIEIDLCGNTNPFNFLVYAT